MCFVNTSCVYPIKIYATESGHVHDSVLSLDRKFSNPKTAAFFLSKFPTSLAKLTLRSFTGVKEWVKIKKCIKWSCTSTSTDKGTTEENLCLDGGRLSR